MGRLLVLLFFAMIALMAVALISCLSAEQGEVRGLPRVVWALIIVLLPIVGAVAYFAAGRPVPVAAGHRGWGGLSVGEPAATRTPAPAPDDDPEFLRGIDGHGRRAEDELLRRWEEEFNRPSVDPRTITPPSVKPPPVKPPPVNPPPGKSSQKDPEPKEPPTIDG